MSTGPVPSSASVAGNISEMISIIDTSRSSMHEYHQSILKLHAAKDIVSPEGESDHRKASAVALAGISAGLTVIEELLNKLRDRNNVNLPRLWRTLAIMKHEFACLKATSETKYGKAESADPISDNHDWLVKFFKDYKPAT